MKSDENSFRVLCLLESSHSFEPRIEETDVRLKPVRGGWNLSIDKVHKGMTAGFFEAHKNIVMDRVESENIRCNQPLQMLPA